MKHVLFLLVVAALAVEAQSADVLSAPTGVEAFDTPNDGGGSIMVTWPRWDAAPAGTLYEIHISESADGPFHLAAEIGAAGHLMTDDPATFGHGDDNARFHFANVSGFTPASADSATSLEDGHTYYVVVGIRDPSGSLTMGTEVLAATPGGNYFNTAKTNNLILGIVFSILILVYIAVARRKELYIRRIAGLEAIDEALGRATEMGKPVLFIHGLKSMDQIPTIAATNILGRIARRTARFDTDLRVTNADPVVMAVSQEVVKEAYIAEGRPDAFNPDSVFMAGTDQFSYAAAVQGIMVRERPAAHIMMGYFYAESLLLAETGSATGAIQIAGTDAYTQLPFFITTCDYTLMGEELYAASAYLSREPRLLGSLKGQDIGKGILIAVVLFGTLLATIDVNFVTHLFTSY